MAADAGKTTAGGLKSCQGVVHQVTVEPAVAVLERVDIQKAEGKSRRCHHGIELMGSLPIEHDHAFDESGQVLRPRASMVGHRVQTDGRAA